MINEISQKIKTLRKQQNLTLKDLSLKCGFSVSFLSQVENGTSSLAIVSLKKIADALSVPIIYFFQNTDNNTYRVKNSEHVEFNMNGTKSRFIKISGNFPNRNMDSLIIKIEPYSEHCKMMSHSGEEFVYVLKGSIKVKIDNIDYILHKGDSIHYPSNISHSWINILDEEAHILSTISNKIF